MKHKILMLVFFCFLFLCCCSKNTEVTPETIESSSEEPSYPEYFLKLVDSYNSSAKTYNLSYKTPMFIAMEEGTKNDFFSFKYNFGIQSLNDPSSCVTESIYELPDSNVPKSYEITFDNNFDNETIKDFILATILFTDNSIDYNSAMEKSKIITNSYKGSGCSELVESGQYLIFLKKTNILEPFDRFYVKHKNEINIPPNLENYNAGTYDDISATLNSGSEIFIQVRIDEIHLSDTLNNPDTLIVSDASGNTFEVYYQYDDFCIDFETEKIYTFYGVITKSKGLRLEYVEM